MSKVANLSNSAERVRDLLNNLARGAKDANEIAERLRLQGIQGVPRNPWKCPINCYLRRTIPNEECVEISVGSSAVRVNESGLKDEFTALPARIADFVVRFDGDWYPSLQG